MNKKLNIEDTVDFYYRSSKGAMDLCPVRLIFPPEGGKIN